MFIKQKSTQILTDNQGIIQAAKQMYDEKTHSIANRIVSIHQSHIRPIVRGKEGRNVEFGAKINVSLQNNYARINQFDFEAFNECVDFLMKYIFCHVL